LIRELSVQAALDLVRRRCMKGTPQVTKL